jgi:hypothetical protein
MGNQPIKDGGPAFPMQEINQLRARPTPAPWIANGYDVSQYGGRSIAYFGPHHTPPREYPTQCRREDEANAAHAVACVNEIDQLKARAESAEALVAELWEQFMDLIAGGCLNLHEESRVRAALAKTPADMGKVFTESALKQAWGTPAGLRAHVLRYGPEGYDISSPEDRAELARLRSLIAEQSELAARDHAEFSALRQQLAERNAEIVRLKGQHNIDLAEIREQHNQEAREWGSDDERDALRARVAELDADVARESAHRAIADAQLAQAEARNARLVAAGDESCIPCELIGFDCTDCTLTIRFDRPIMDLPRMRLGQRAGFSPFAFADHARAAKEGKE